MFDAYFFCFKPTDNSRNRLLYLKVSWKIFNFFLAVTNILVVSATFSPSAMNGSNSMKRFGSSSFHKEYEPVTQDGNNRASNGASQETYDIPVGTFCNCMKRAFYSLIHKEKYMWIFRFAIFFRNIKFKYFFQELLRIIFRRAFCTRWRQPTNTRQKIRMSCSLRWARWFRSCSTRILKIR